MNTGKAGNMDRGKWESETEDFRRSAPLPTMHNGKPYLLTVCQELVGGRWEGFVSMQPLPLASSRIQ